MRPPLLLSLALAVPCGCASVPRASGPSDPLGAGACSFRAPIEATRVAAGRALESLGYALERFTADEVVGRSDVETRFFGLVGEQRKERVVTLRLRRERDGRTRVEAMLVRVHGAVGAGGPVEERVFDDDWTERLFERVRVELAELAAPRGAA